MRFAVFAVTLLFTFPAFALCSQNPDHFAQMLARAENPEYIATQAIDTQGQLHTVFANEKTGDWTVTITDLQTGMTCIATAGKGWRRVEPEKPNY